MHYRWVKMLITKREKIEEKKFRNSMRFKKNYARSQYKLNKSIIMKKKLSAVHGL